MTTAVNTLVNMPGLEPDEMLVAFTRTVRHAGVAVSADRTQAFLRATSIADAGDRQGLFWAGRSTLCSSPEDLERYDAAFRAWFSDEPPPRLHGEPSTRTVQRASLEPEASGEREGEEQAVRALASANEVLRHRDIAQLSAAERHSLATLFAGLRVDPPRRRSPRRGPSHRGEIDPRRTLREQLQRAGEPGPLRHRRPRTKARRVVLLVDVSGSMEPYADSLLRLGHRMSHAVPGRVEVFTIGTRLTRVTTALRLRDPDEALEAAGQSVPDWSGGTRLGESIRAFTVRWGQRGMARGSVVVIASDGWERGDPRLLGEQVARLQRLAHTVVWMNPHRGKVGYQPVQGGIAAALPYVDQLVAGHSLASFAELLKVVAHA
ncbi:MAG TPA: VWA domain-containing protein [Dermatophilaceae bacterium]